MGAQKHHDNTKKFWESSHQYKLIINNSLSSLSHKKTSLFAILGTYG